MKRVVISVVILLTAATASSVTSQYGSGWIEVTSGSEPFTVIMPKRASVDTEKAVFGLLKVSGKRYVTSADETAYVVWSVVNNNFPHQQFQDSSEYLDACADLLWESLLKPRRDELPRKKQGRARMTYVREMPNSPLPGREYTLALGDSAGLTRLYARAADVYILAVLSNRLDAAKTATFFNSFTLRPSAPTPVPSSGGSGGFGPGVLGRPEDPTDYTRVFSGREVTEKARILAKPEPHYTEGARKFRVQGTVVLRAVLSKEGVVTKTYLVRRLPHGLTEAALAAAREIRFTPALKDGHAVSQYIQLEYNFNLY